MIFRKTYYSSLFTRLCGLEELERPFTQMKRRAGGQVIRIAETVIQIDVCLFMKFNLKKKNHPISFFLSLLNFFVLVYFGSPASYTKINAQNYIF